MIRNPVEWDGKTYTIHWVEWDGALYSTHRAKFDTYTEALVESSLLAGYYPWHVIECAVYEVLPPGGDLGLLSWEGKSNEQISCGDGVRGV